MDTPCVASRPDAITAAIPELSAWARRAIRRALPVGHERCVSVDDVLQRVALAWVSGGRPQAVSVLDGLKMAKRAREASMKADAKNADRCRTHAAT